MTGSRFDARVQALHAAVIENAAHLAGRALSEEGRKRERERTLVRAEELAAWLLEARL